MIYGIFLALLDFLNGQNYTKKQLQNKRHSKGSIFSFIQTSHNASQ